MHSANFLTTFPTKRCSNQDYRPELKQSERVEQAMKPRSSVQYWELKTIDEIDVLAVSTLTL